jgi:beta-galactosidase
VGLLLLEDAQFFCYSFYDSTDYYSLAYQGAYEAFLDCNIQADPILLKHIDNYKTLYLPFPVSLGDEVIEKLKTWVEAGGTLIAEGCFGYFSREGHAFEHQPSRGLDALCGVKQDTVSFGPDMWHNLEFDTASGVLAGGVYRQSYIPTTAKATAWYADGRAAVVENRFGRGKVRLVGTMAGYGYKLHPKAEHLRFFASVLPFAGHTQYIRADYNTGLIVRLWANDSDTFLWCLNQQSYRQHALLRVDDSLARFTAVSSLRDSVRDSIATLENGLLSFDIEGRDGVVYALS